MLINEMFEYKVENGLVTITKYFGDSALVTVPNDIDGMPVVAIGRSAFRHCDWVVSVVLPDTIEILYDFAFAFCLQIDYIKIPANLKIVGVGVFQCCINITELVFPVGVEKIGAYCFDRCGELTRLFVLNENAIFSRKAFGFFDTCPDEMSFHLIKTLQPKYQAQFITEDIENWDYIEQSKKDEVSKIIYNNQKLQEILFFSNNFTIIKFLFEQNIKPNLENTLRYIEHYITQKDVNINAILLDYKNKIFTQAEVDAFVERKELICSGLVEMNFSEFNKTWVISKINDGYQINGYLGDKNEVTIPAEFDGRRITSLSKFRESFHKNRSVEILNIDAPLKTIPKKCFIYNQKLTKITIPDTVTSIGDKAFSICLKLAEIVLPENLISIGHSAFSKCNSLVSVKIPASVTDFGKQVFRTLEQLTSVEICANIDTLGYSTFDGCDVLTDVILPDSITTFEPRVFHNCVGLKEITLPQNLLSLQKNSFDRCEKLERVNFNKKLTRIDSQVFAKCENLTCVELPESLEFIGELAFYWCLSLEEIVIPASVKFIGDKAFCCCENLKSVTFLGERPTLGLDVFEKTPIEKDFS